MGEDDQLSNCPHCQHPTTHHFQHTDEIGYYAFCVIEDCECWIDRGNDGLEQT